MELQQLLPINSVYGAKEAGHQITRFETAELDIHPCKGCGTCRENNGKCVYEDDMNQIYPHLIGG